MALIVDAIPIICQNHTLQKLYTTSQMGSQPVVIRTSLTTNKMLHMGCCFIVGFVASFEDDVASST